MPIIFEDYNPKTLEEAVEFIHLNLDTSEYLYIEEYGNMGLHHTFGMAMRNAWGLWHGSVIAIHFNNKYSIGHADDMSGMILEAVRCKVLGVPYDPYHEAQTYRDYWIKQGIDPLTQARLK